jgi:two-component system LytT family response regulator
MATPENRLPDGPRRAGETALNLRVVVVDDEAIARRRITRLLQSEPGVTVVAECADVDAAVETIRNEAPDLVFLDIQLPERDGFGVIEAVGAEHMPAVIFVTAHDQYAIRAFEVHALDYLLKPFSPERFRESLQRATSRLSRAEAEHGRNLADLLDSVRAEQSKLERLILGSREGYLQRLLVKAHNRMIFVRSSDVTWFEAEGNYVRVHVGRESYVVRDTMNNLETKLDPSQFLRIHRSTIVNIDHVKEMHMWFAGDYIVVLQDGTELKLSRGYREKMEERLK